MRPRHPHAAESGVGEHTARESERAQQCATGKERVANAHPQIWPRDRKVPGPYYFAGAKRNSFLRKHTDRIRRATSDHSLPRLPTPFRTRTLALFFQANTPSAP